MINKVLGMLGLGAKAGKIISGMDACIEAMRKQKIKTILVAKDASEKTKKNISFYADKNNIPVFIYGEIEVISQAIR